MPSSLKRMFDYAKAAEVEALENFTTEALAAAIRAESSPMVGALRKLGALEVGDSDEPARVVVNTQSHMPGAGTIDLVLLVESGADVSEVWLEVKVHSGEHGQQLANYRQYLDAVDALRRPALVVLSKEPLDTPVRLRQLRWQELWRASAPGHTNSPHWLELRRFLEENGMVNPYEAPATARESCALGDAFTLLRKMELVLWPVAQHAATLMPTWGWPSKPRAVHVQLGRSFRKFGNYSLGYRARFRAGISCGVYRDEESDESWVGVRVWSDPKGTPLRRQLHASVEGRLSTDWERSFGSWDAVVIYRRLAAFDDLTSITDWLKEHLSELGAAGVVELLPALGAPIPDESPPGEYDDEDKES